jgi:hypothetical protein
MHSGAPPAARKPNRPLHPVWDGVTDLSRVRSAQPRRSTRRTTPPLITASHRENIAAPWSE